MFVRPRNTVTTSPSHANRVSATPMATSTPTISTQLGVDVNSPPCHTLILSSHHVSTCFVYTVVLTLRSARATGGGDRVQPVILYRLLQVQLRCFKSRCIICTVLQQTPLSLGNHPEDDDESLEAHERVRPRADCDFLAVFD